ncbi:DUF1707 SHOCT-like domain-containing protein [Kribbella jiaozuonensis]|uniref:DUF1707 domain-containing protein n=1 Tax=Kribbella jiaozuonensis TaxID=2575441 RepID=A0A4U3LUC7_9ACTN|nr:DUF1707 domain-containing protein [Kribbella jiaozuonensis]TKK79681.1 DUF1707 domain-containing protein [Kribbella jiaozuonensis]
MSLEQPPPGHRASDNDRERAAAVVQEAHTDGRLDFEELDERLTQIYTAKTQLELRNATADLMPVAHGSTQELTLRARHSAQKREGAWVVPERLTAIAEHSSVKLDFTDAVVHWADIHVDAQAIHSSVVMVIPEGWSVDIDQVEANHSSAKNKAVAPRPGGVRLHVTGRAHHASVIVRHPRKRHWWWPWYRK